MSRLGSVLQTRPSVWNRTQLQGVCEVHSKGCDAIAIGAGLVHVSMTRISSGEDGGGRGKGGCCHGHACSCALLLGEIAAEGSGSMKDPCTSLAGSAGCGCSSSPFAGPDSAGITEVLSQLSRLPDSKSAAFSAGSWGVQNMTPPFQSSS